MLLRVNFQQPVRTVAIERIKHNFVGVSTARPVGAHRVRPFFRSRKNVSASDNPYHAPKSTSQTPSTALVGALQWTCIFTVLGIQAGLIVERIHKQKAGRQRVQLSSNTVDVPTSTSFGSEFAQHQPLLLAVGVACALLTKRSTDNREQQQQQPATVASAALHQRAVLQNLDGSIRQMDRKLSKMQSRVLLCVEQYRGVRTSSDEARATMNNILSTHGTALAELQEQTNSLQKVVSSMQDVVVKQIQVMAPPLKSLSTRVRSLEQELQALKDQVHSQQATPQSVASRTETGPNGSTQPVATQQPQQSQLQHQSICNGPHTGAAANSVTLRGAGQHARSLTTDCRHDGCPGSSDTDLNQQGSGRMRLASWRAPHFSRSSLQLQASRVEASIQDHAGTPDSSSDRHSKALLSDNTVSHNVSAGGSMGKQRSLPMGFAPLNPLHVPHSASQSIAVAAQPVVALKTAEVATRQNDALHSLLLPSPSPIMSPVVSVPTQGASTASRWQPGDNESGTEAASQFTVPADTSASMTGIRGMLLAASLIVNLLVAQACV